ncbi:TMEM175 family protein [Cellulomonas sp.]|uniref:TMEM175 family protein n=1 Tax=Cellulomonas sp. TaxID=40001 RepID=UPI003BA94667
MALIEPQRRTGRLEAFSDAVFAIALTLLVLDLLPERAQSPHQLLENWPAYLAYLTAFLTIGTVWLNHNEAIARVRHADPIVMLLNLGVLLGASLVPWPTVLVSNALREGDRADQVAAMMVFAGVAVIISVPWVVLDLYLARRPRLLNSSADVTWMNRHAVISAGTLLIAGVSVGVAFVSPLASLVLYLPVFAVFIAARVVETNSEFGRETGGDPA